jgi:putative sigma-54 modulation protein
MNLNYKIKNEEVDEEIKKYVQEKIGGLIDQYLEKLDKKINIPIEVEIKKETHHRKGNVVYTEVNIKVPGKILRASTYALTVQAGIDEIEDDLKRQIKKYKEKKESKLRKDWLKLKSFLRGEKRE